MHVSQLQFAQTTSEQIMFLYLRRVCKNFTLSKNHAAPKPVLSCPILILVSRPRDAAHDTVKESFLKEKINKDLIHQSCFYFFNVLKEIGLCNNARCYIQGRERNRMA